MSRLQRRILFGALLLISLSGCQRSYSYVLHGVVKIAADGSTLAGVVVTVNADGVSHQTGFPFTTNGDGKFRARFDINEREFSEGKIRKWSLTLSRDGFEDEEVDISPTQEPSGGNEVQIEVVAYLRAK
jgi:hypothetical protein